MTLSKALRCAAASDTAAGILSRPSILMAFAVAILLSVLLASRVAVRTKHPDVVSDPSEARGNEADPENRLLWKFNRRRLEAEELRDTMLAIAGG